MSRALIATEEAVCPGCEAAGGETLYEAADFLYGVDPRPFPVVRCGGCRLVYLGRRPTVGAVADAYPDHYLWRLADTAPRAPGLDAAMAAWWFRQLYARRARLAARHLPAGRPARVLELGCGTGHFLRALQALAPGNAYVGMDFEVGGAPPGMTFVAGNVEEAALAEREAGPFDLVCMWHVLEHLHRPRRALEAAAARLAPGGKLLVGTQNFDAISRVLKGASWPLNDVPRHLVHFTPATLVPLVAAAGFGDVRVMHATEMFPSLGGFLFPGAATRPDGRLRAVPAALLAGAFALPEAAAVLAGRGCTFNLVATKG